MDVPGLNPAEINDEKLLEHINQVRFNMSRVRHQPHLYRSMLMILDALEAEHRERIVRRRMEEHLEKNPSNVIELGTIEGIGPQK